MPGSGLIGRLVDVEGPGKAWARAQPAITALVAARVFLELPTSPVYPLLRVTAIPGAGPTGDQPTWAQLFQFDAFALTRAAASELAWAVANAANDLAGDTPMGTTLVATSALVTGTPAFEPEPDTALVPNSTRRIARYSTDVLFTVRSAGT